MARTACCIYGFNKGDVIQARNVVRKVQDHTAMRADEEDMKEAEGAAGGE